MGVEHKIEMRMTFSRCPLLDFRERGKGECLVPS